MRARLLIALVCLAPLLRAEEGGSGHYLPGSIASFADAVPPAETFIVRYNLVAYEGDYRRGEPLPIAGLSAAGVDAESWANGLTLLWRPPLEIGPAWSYALSATLPIVAIDVEADVTTAGGTTVRRSDDADGLGDAVLVPLMLGYAFSRDLSANARLNLYAPTGDYETGRLANTGKNFWTVEPLLGILYFGQQSGRECALYAGADFNEENPDTDYQSGTQVHLDGTLAQHLPLAGGVAGAGVSGFWYEQVSGDSGDGATFGDFEGKTRGLGPVVSYVHGNLIAELKWLHETETEKRLEGDIVWFKAIMKF